MLDYTEQERREEDDGDNVDHESCGDATDGEAQGETQVAREETRQVCLERGKEN